MDKNKLVNKFLQMKESENKRLDENITNLEQSLEKLDKENKELYKKLKEERLRNAILSNRYGMLLDDIKEKGIIFKIKNTNLGVVEWQNLYFRDSGKNIYIESLDRHLIHEFDNNMSSLIRILIKENEYSLIVIRMNEKNVKIQFRVIEKQDKNIT
ncbi:hypothetical protein NL50_12570 [Clostridium acetobutylicum]|nr:hypothetical protein NL50_12570 [Clostridium acetobutylicum]